MNTTPTYEAIAQKHGLTGRLAERYIAYMTARWKSNERVNCLCGYASEWAERFNNRMEYQCSDMIGQSVLKDIDRQS